MKIERFEDPDSNGFDEKEMKCYDFPKYVFAGREMLLYYLPLINLQNSLYVFLAAR